MSQAKPALLILTSSFPASSDDETCGYVRELARCLAQEFTVQVLAPADVRANDSSDEAFTLVRSKSFLPAALDPVQASRDLHALLSGNLLTRILTVISLLGFFVKAFRLARRAEVICSHWLLPAGLMGAVLSKILRKPHLVIEHSGALHLLRRRRGGKWLARFIVSGSQRVVTVSHDLQEKLLELCPATQAKTAVIPMGIDRLSVGAGLVPARITAEEDVHFASQNPGRDKPCPYNLLFIGRLVEIKGAHILLQAAATLPDVQVMIAGDGEQRRALTGLAKKLNVDAVFYGQVGKAEKMRLLKWCDAVVVSSVCLPDGRCEGMPVVALEALAAGRPLIAARVGGLSEIIEDGQNGLLFAAGDALQLADKINLLRDDETLRERLAMNAKRTARAYDWQIIGARYCDILKEALTANGSITGYHTAADSHL